LQLRKSPVQHHQGAYFLQAGRYLPFYRRDMKPNRKKKHIFARWWAHAGNSHTPIIDNQVMMKE